MIPKMLGLKEKIKAKAEVREAIAELAEEKVSPKVKPLKVKGRKYKKIKK
jgi:hypothetical protein